MKLIYGVLLFVGVFALNNAQSSTTLKRIATDQLLMQHLMRATKSNDPSLTLQCFQLYTPVFEAILEEYTICYLNCTKKAETQIKQINEEASANQTLISTSAQDVCNKMIACSNLESLDFFDCYANEGDGNIKTIWGLTNSAISEAAYLRGEYQVIEYNKAKCQNASDEAYVLETTTTKEALNYCLANGPPEIVSETAAPVEAMIYNDITSTEKPLNVLQRTTEAVPEATGFEEEDLSRSAPLMVPNKYKRLGGL